VNNKEKQSDHSHHSQCHDSATSGPASNHSHTSDARPKPKRGDVPCRAWKAGNCTRGTKCRFRHNVDVQIEPGLGLTVFHQEKASAPPLPTEDPGPSTSSSAPEIERVRAEAAARARADTIARKEAAKTMIQLMSGSLVAFSAGLDVAYLVTGFETCTVFVRNIPLDATDIRSLLRDKGLELDRVHLDVQKRSNNKRQASIVTDITSGRALASSLDGVEFHDDALVVDMVATNALEGMNAKSDQGSEILTISWHAPSVRYVAEYVDIDAARAQVEKLNRSIHCGRRLKVEMNAQPPGRFVPNLRLNAIKIRNLPPSVTDGEVIGFTGALSVKRLRAGGAFVVTYTTQQMAQRVRDDIELAVPGGLTRFEDPPSGACTIDGIITARAHFASWDEASVAYTHLSDKRYYNQPVWLRLPDPMYFTLVIPAEQYKAQKAQWDSLSSSIIDKKACTLNVRDASNVMLVRLSGSVKEATGALKVRVENLARGEKVEGWHRSLGFPGNQFMLRVNSETGAYVRAHGKSKSLKVYGSPRAVDQAREMIKEELQRLASLDYTVTLPRHSVGFFVREGLQQLKETLGENNVKFVMLSGKITVSGGEEARHALDRIITLSHKGNMGGLASASQGDQTCPICYDVVSSPHRLGCGHVYCTACLRHFVSSAVDSSDQLPLTCLGDEARCRVPIPIPVIQQFLAPAAFNRLLEAAFDAYITKRPEVFKHCKTPDCTQIYRTALAIDPVNGTPQILHCPSCFSAVCNGCHEDAHEGMSCAESRARRVTAEQERLNDVWITEQGGRVKKCPQCSVLIEKLRFGCNHMTCQCGAHICWRCMGIFSPEAIYPHMETVHGTYYGDEGSRRWGCTIM